MAISRFSLAQCKLNKLALSSMILLAGASQGYAQSIWTNPITGTNPNLSNPYTTGQTVNANLAVSGIGRGTGIAGNSANNRYNANSWTTGTSLDPNDYFTFTITPQAGFPVNLSSFTYTGQASGSGPISAVFRSSRDNFGTDIGSANITGTTISLSAPTYQRLTSAVEFRLYGFGNTNGGPTGTFSVNDFTFNGVVLPEPSSVALLGLGLTGIFAVARRRKNS